MRRRRFLLAFVGRLLNIGTDVVASSPSSSASSRPPPWRRRPSAPSPPAGASSLRRQAFVHPDAGAARGGGPFPPSPPSPSRRKPTLRVGTVAPRRYVDSSVADGEAIAAPNPLCEVVPLLSPHLEFSELELMALPSPKRAGIGVEVEVDTSPAAVLCTEFEEGDIGHFQSAKEGGGASSPFFFASERATTTQSHPKKDSTSPTLPPWLSLNQARSAPGKVRRLQQSLEPHLSSGKIGEVVRALHAAACDAPGATTDVFGGTDRKKVAGAADFCSLLVDSLEITDAPALCAAAFHYGSLVAVRERELAAHGGHAATPRPAERECLCLAGSDAKYLCALSGLPLERFGETAVKIALDAARLKSMEEIATTVFRKNGRRGALSSTDARNFRRLLLTVNEEGDWRALAFRAAACLYRLEGLEAHRSRRRPTGKTRAVSLEEARTGQEALHIYAPLAARLGMFRLKTELEDAAFRTLYPRSHAKVAALCGGANAVNDVGEGMRSVLDDISVQIKRLVQEDCAFMEHIENVSVTARVKKPYSIWRKIVKMSREGEGVNTRHFSILDIPDAVAVRIVFSARKLVPDESDAETRHREQELCYYLHDLCQRKLPMERRDDSRFKDYIKHPKENGYQSLHFSSHKRWRGTEWPFEVQIRSKAMNHVAEYGKAAHWSYKRKNVDGDEATEIPLDRTSEAYLTSAQEWHSKEENKDSAKVVPSAELNEPTWYLEEELRRQRKRDRDKALAPYLEALSSAQTDMTREHVFVFVSVQPPKAEQESAAAPRKPPPGTEGTVLSLPTGSSVLDAVRVAEGWSSILEASGQLYDGRDSFVALRNGLRTSSLGTEVLASGDVIRIVASEDMIPSFSNGHAKSDFNGNPFSTDLCSVC